MKAAEAIVTGTRIYAGDHFPDGCLYGAYLLPEYHAGSTKLLSADQWLKMRA